MDMKDKILLAKSFKNWSKGWYPSESTKSEIEDYLNNNLPNGFNIKDAQEILSDNTINWANLVRQNK